MLSNCKLLLNKVEVHRGLKFINGKKGKPFIIMYYTEENTYGWYVNTIPQIRYRVRVYK